MLVPRNCRFLALHPACQCSCKIYNRAQALHAAPRTDTRNTAFGGNCVSSSINRAAVSMLSVNAAAGRADDLLVRS
jgi:hypothetical protein